MSLNWYEGPGDSLIARLGSLLTLHWAFYQIIPVLDEYQLVLATPGGVELLGTHPTIEAAQAAARTHVGDDD